MKLAMSVVPEASDLSSKSIFPNRNGSLSSYRRNVSRTVYLLTCISNTLQGDVEVLASSEIIIPDR